jgi:hypothetical protein
MYLRANDICSRTFLSRAMHFGSRRLARVWVFGCGDESQLYPAVEVPKAACKLDGFDVDTGRADSTKSSAQVMERTTGTYN